MGKNYITAAEARELSQTTDKLISIMFKNIKSEAENGYSEFTFCLDRVSTTGFNRLYGALMEAGFNVKFYYDSQVIELHEDDVMDAQGHIDRKIDGIVPLGIKIIW